jgi:hypothetical protein
MLARRLWRSLSTTGKELEVKMQDLNEKLKQFVPSNSADLAHRDFSEPKEPTLDERLAMLDRNIAKIETLRAKARPVEEKFQNMEMKYGRAGRFPAYPEFGEAVPYEYRYPHLAEKLGSYSETVPSEGVANDMFQVNSDLNNPVFRSNFVQQPNKEPDSDLNFEKGEILYENKDVDSGLDLTRQLGYSTFGYISFYVAQGIASGRFTYPVYNENLDTRADTNTATNSLVGSTNSGAWHGIDEWSMFMFITPLPLLMVTGYFGLLNNITRDYVVKMQYNAEKDLLFVTKTSGVFMKKQIEKVYEVTHLQVLPPSPRTGYEDLLKGPIITVHCMNTQESFILYKDEKYWNSELKNLFEERIYDLWS